MPPAEGGWLWSHPWEMPCVGGAGSLPPSTAGHGGGHRRLQYWGEELSQGEPRSQPLPPPRKRCVLDTGLSRPPLSGDRTAVGMHLALKDGSPASGSSSLALTSPRYSQRRRSGPLSARVQLQPHLCPVPSLRDRLAGSAGPGWLPTLPNSSPRARLVHPEGPSWTSSSVPPGLWVRGLNPRGLWFSPSSSPMGHPTQTRELGSKQTALSPQSPSQRHGAGSQRAAHLVRGPARRPLRRSHSLPPQQPLARPRTRRRSRPSLPARPQPGPAVPNAP